MKKPLISCLLLLGLLSFLCCRSKEKSEKAIPPFSFVRSAQVFEPNRTFQAGLVDLDGDGDLDAVLPNRGPIHSQVLINDGKSYRTLLNDGAGNFIKHWLPNESIVDDCYLQRLDAAKRSWLT